MSAYAYASVKASLQSLLQQTILTLYVQVYLACVKSANLRDSVSHRTRFKRAKLRDFCFVMSHKDLELNEMIVIHTIASIYHKNMLTYLSADITCS